MEFFDRIEYRSQEQSFKKEERDIVQKVEEKGEVEKTVGRLPDNQISVRTGRLVANRYAYLCNYVPTFE